MAYNFPTATQDFGYGIGESEEERKRREEEERQRREQEAAMQAQQQAEAEAQRQREEQEAQLRAQQAAQSAQGGPVAPGQAVKQIPGGIAAPTVSGSVPEAPAAAQGGPVAPDQADIERQRQLQQAQAAQAEQAQAQQAQMQAQQAAQQPAPVAPQAPQQPVAAAPQQAAPQMTMEERIAAAAQRAQERAAASQQQPTEQPQGAAPAMPQLPKPGPGVQVASTEPSAGVAEAAKAQQAAQSPWAAALEAGKNDLTALGKILAGDAPEDIKSEAQDRLLNMKLDRDQQKKVDRIVTGVQSGDPKSINDLTRELKTRSEEGSLLKAYMYARLGLNKLAEEEQMKLGGGTTYASFMGTDGQPYTVRVNGRGGVEKAFDSFGRAVDDTQLAAINAGYMGMKGAETGKQQFKDEKGDIYTFSTVPGRAGGIYTNTSTGRQSATAPKGLVPLSYQSPQERAAVSAGKQVMDKMRAENTKSEAQGAGTKFTEEQIQAAGDAASAAIYQGRGTPTTTVSGTGVESTATAAVGSDLSEGLRKKIVSGGRTTAEQQALYDESVRAGRPGRTATGLPIAKPGTSQHEKNNAIDMPRDLSDEEIAELVQKGYRRSKSDPVHWEKTGGAAPSTQRAPAVAAVRQQAEAIYNGDEKAPTGMGSDNHRARAVMDEVRRIAQEQGRPYDPTLYTVREKTRKDFSGSGQAAKSVQSMNVAIDHLDTLQSAATALNNGQIPIFNKYSNMYAKNTGNPAPTDFDSTKKIVSSEVAKAVTGSQMALADREEVQKNLDNALNPAQLAGVIKRTQELLAGQLKGLKTTYESVGLKDFDSKLTPRTREILSQPEGGGAPQSPAEKAKAEIARRKREQ